MSFQLHSQCLRLASVDCLQMSVRPGCKTYSEHCEKRPVGSWRVGHRRIREPPMDTPRTEATGDQGPQRPTVGPSTKPEGPAPRANGPAVKAKASRPVRYPIQLKVNINQAMAASLQRVCLRWGIPEGIGARIAITQFLGHQDPQYRGDGNA